MKNVTQIYEKKKSPLIIGIVNVTPDSFSDGGKYLAKDEAVSHALHLIEEGADIIDVGGESTRPGSESVNYKEETARVIPVICDLVKKTDIPVSIDTVKADVAEEAVLSGARMINDVSGLKHDEKMAGVAAKYGVDLILMHSRKKPENMQVDISYSNLMEEIKEELLQSVDKALDKGVKAESIWLDPGIGFAKTAQHNLEILAKLDEIVRLGYPVLTGPSRKSFIGEVTKSKAMNRLGGTATSVAASVFAGVRAVRVHDVEVMREAAIIASEIADYRTIAGRKIKDGNIR